MSQQPAIAVGTYTGNGAAISISIGFVPDYVRVINITDGDATWDWFAGMAAGTAIKTDTAVANLASNGVTAYAGSTTASPGFTIGTDLSESAKVHRWVAMRGA